MKECWCLSSCLVEISKKRSTTPPSPKFSHGNSNNHCIPTCTSSRIPPRETPPSILNGNIKSSNILLENPESCKLCDFGFTKMGFSSSVKSRTSTSSRIEMMGSPCYIDHHYLMTRIASKNSDIYNFGVVLFEPITGLEVFLPKKEKLLASIVRTNNRDFDIEKVVNMIDLAWLGFDVKEVRAMAWILSMCLHHLPSLRPFATEICQEVQESILSLSCLCVSSKV